jgi:hypothetical protein
MKKTFEEYIQSELRQGKIDFSFRARFADDGHVCFYVHPSYFDGETQDFKVEGNTLVDDPCVWSADGKV